MLNLLCTLFDDLLFCAFLQNLYWLYLCHETKQDFIFLYIALLFYSRVKVADMDYDQKCLDIAKRTEGLSGREISKLGVAWQVWQLCHTLLSWFWIGRIVQHIHSQEGNNIISEFEACVGWSNSAIEIMSFTFIKEFTYCSFTKTCRPIGKC